MQNQATPQTPAGLVGNMLDYYQLSQMSDQEIQNLFGIRDIFFQELDFAAVAAAATPQASFTVQNDANWLWQGGSYIADVAAAAVTDSTRVIPLVSCTILDQTSGRQLMQANTPIVNIFGTGEMPFWLPTPRFFRANTQVTFNLLNFSAATTYNLKLTLIGTKFYKFAQPI